MRIICLSSACLLSLLLAPLTAADRPNIILMMSDDQGWNGTSVAMHPDIPGSKGEIYHTPNLERLAAQGMRFSAGYSPAPVCSPTRISIQTGKSPAQLHWTKAAPAEPGHKLTEPRLIKQISSSEKTLGELLQSVGYATAHYGKWHISGGGPEQHGYDQSDGDTGNENAFQYQDPNPVDIFGMADKAEKFMAQARKAGKPFYIQLSWNALHASENALRATMAKYEQKLGASAGKRAAVAAITEDLDTGVGKVMDSIDRLGLTDSTPGSSTSQTTVPEVVVAVVLRCEVARVASGREGFGFRGLSVVPDCPPTPGATPELSGMTCCPHSANWPAFLRMPSRSRLKAAVLPHCCATRGREQSSDRGPSWSFTFLTIRHPTVRSLPCCWVT